MKEAIGLPRLEAKNTIDGYLDLVEQGVLCTIGPLITDNSIALAPVIDATGVPAVTWTGTDRYFGDYCFNLGNGGLAEEAAIMATWIRRSGYRTVGMIHEISPGGVEYACNFRWYAAREKLDILIEAYTTQVPDDLEAMLREDPRPEARLPRVPRLRLPDHPHAARCSRRLGWNPPRIMTTAFQFCYAKPEWMAALEGWYGVDQMCEAEPAPRSRCSTASPRVTGKRRDHTVTALSYDTARLDRRGPRARANLLTPKGVKEGLEKVRMLPAVNGGPRTHMSLGPYDHKAYKGDWLRAAPHRGRPHGLGRSPRPGEDDDLPAGDRTVTRARGGGRVPRRAPARDRDSARATRGSDGSSRRRARRGCACGEIGRRRPTSSPVPVRSLPDPRPLRAGGRRAVTAVGAIAASAPHAMRDAVVQGERMGRYRRADATAISERSGGASLQRRLGAPQ